MDSTPSPEEDKDVSSSDRQLEAPLSSVVENGAATVTSTSFNGGVSPPTWGDSSPPCKKSRKQAECHRYPQEEGSPGGAAGEAPRPRARPSPPSPSAAKEPVADSSTRADSPSHGLVTSSLCGPARASQRHPAQPGAYKMSVATQCDPEEIIVLSDSD